MTHTRLATPPLATMSIPQFHVSTCVVGRKIKYFRAKARVDHLVLAALSRFRTIQEKKKRRKKKNNKKQRHRLRVGVFRLYMTLCVGRGSLSLTLYMTVMTEGVCPSPCT